VIFSFIIGVFYCTVFPRYTPDWRNQVQLTCSPVWENWGRRRSCASQLSDSGK